MPSSYDIRQLPVDRDPSKNMFTGLSLPTTGLTNTDFITSIITQIASLFGIDLSSPEALLNSLGNLATQIENGWNEFIASLGQIPAWLLGNVSIGALSGTPQNMLANPGFRGAISISTTSDSWAWDDTVYRTAAAAGDPALPGSAMVTADGSPHELQSNIVNVSGGQVLSFDIRVAAVGLTGTGDLLTIRAVPFLDGTAGTPVDIDASGVPTGSEVWAAPPAGTVVTAELSGDYTVPDDGTVDQVALRIGITAAATAGKAWWDDASELPVGLIQQAWVDGLQDDLSALSDDIQAGSDAFKAFMQAVVAAFSDDSGNWPALLTDIEAAWSTYVTTVTDLVSGEFSTLQDFLLRLIGLDPSTRLFSPSLVDGLPSLQDDFDAASAWLTRLINDELILSDVFHLTYQAGTSGDAPGTLGTNGKPTWYSAWNDLRALFGDANSVSAPTDPAPAIAGAISSASSAAAAAQSTANTAVTNAGTAQSTANTAVTNAGTAQTTANTSTSWATRLTNNTTILADVFHLIYAAGSPTDAPGTLWTGGGIGHGLPTWYSAWNDLLHLNGTVNSVTPPTNAAPTVAAVIVANADAVNQGITGTTTTGANATAVSTAVSGLQTTMAGLQTQVGALQAPVSSPTTILADTGQSSPGSGLGSSWTTTGTAAVNRDATAGFKWTTSGSSGRTCLGIFNTPLATNDQVGSIVLNGLMSYDPFNPSNPVDTGAPYNQIVLRANAPTSPSSYVFARIGYNWVQFGYCASGIEHLLGSPTAFLASASASYTCYAGDTSSDYHYSLVSGGRTIASYDDSSAKLSIGSIAGRYPGQSWTSTPYSLGGEAEPANTSWRSWDASSSAGTPPNYAHVTRIGTGNYTFGGGSGGLFPYNFFDTTVALGSNITLPTSGNNGFIVGEAGVYSFGFGVRMASTANAFDARSNIAVNGSIVECGNYLTWDGGGTIVDGVQWQQSSAALLLNAGDQVSCSITDQGGANLGGNWTGESSGSRTYMKIMKIG